MPTFRPLPSNLSGALMVAAAVHAAVPLPAQAQRDPGTTGDTRSLRLECGATTGGGKDGEFARIDTTPAAARAGAADKAGSAGPGRLRAGQPPVRMQVGAGRQADCTFPSGHTVRVKVGEGEARAYGMCGGDPEVFMSVWVDGRKVESRRWFAGHCYEDGGNGHPRPGIRLEFERTGARTVARSCLVPAQASGGKPACTAYPDLAGMPPDTAEYPPAGKSAARPGTVALLAGSDAVCTEARAALAEDFAAFDKYGKPSRRFAYPAWEDVPASAPALPEDFQGAQQSVFDLDNDGRPERVLKRVFETNYMDGNVLLARYGSTAPLDWSPSADKGLAYLPCQMADSRIAIARCPPLSQDGDEANFTMAAAPGQPPVEFRNRYISVTPFFYRNKTYLGIARAAGRTHAAVLEPLPSGGFRQACLLSRTGRNF